ncbi:MAG: Sjogren's syndrome/scleroderma autoantigen 1 family protein [Candidatus Helarchaeota archaeon]
MSQMDDNGIKKMAQLLKDGNTMLDISCPQCKSPLFRLKNNDIFCAKCQKKVVILKDQQQLDSMNKATLLSELDDILYTKIVTLTNLLRQVDDLDEQNSIIKLIYNYLLTIEKLKSIRKI